VQRISDIWWLQAHVFRLGPQGERAEPAEGATAHEGLTAEEVTRAILPYWVRLPHEVGADVGAQIALDMTKYKTIILLVAPTGASVQQAISDGGQRAMVVLQALKSGDDECNLVYHMHSSLGAKTYVGTYLALLAISHLRTPIVKPASSVRDYFQAQLGFTLGGAKKRAKKKEVTMRIDGQETVPAARIAKALRNVYKAAMQDAESFDCTPMGYINLGATCYIGGCLRLERPGRARVP
jgi:hypothetical protein